MLVVEDVVLIRMATVDMVEQIGFPGREAGDGAEALAILQKDAEHRNPADRSGPAGDEWPSIGGGGTPPEARDQGDHCLGLFQGDIARGKSDGDITYLTKPFDLGQLRRALEV